MRLAVLIVLASASMALGQADPAVPQRAPGSSAARPEPAAQQPRGDPADATAMRERLQRRLNDLNQWADHVKRAIAALDGGATAAEVAAMTEPVGRRDADRPSEPPPPPLDRDRLLAFLRRNSPETAAKIDEALQREPAAGERILARIERQVRDIQAESDPELKEIKLAEARGQWRLAEATRALGQAIRRGEGEERVTAARSGVRALLRDQFDLRMRRQERELARLEERVGKLRQEKQDLLGKRDDMIDGRLRQIEQNASKEPEGSKRGERRRPEDEKDPGENR